MSQSNFRAVFYKVSDIIHFIFRTFPYIASFIIIIIILREHLYNIKVFYTIYAKMKEKGVQKNYLCHTHRKLVVVVKYVYYCLCMA